ncbi:MAG TPA: proton-conducting transporter membrane subunit [Fimbriimonadaceae bacterium]|nr:proton-conducting transporter membrane subunit [Fimbriimonadaceae bacterium]HRE93585.1 proton-conducting transporter membrane subunit [Fimbriimonadaceae bacterium]HRI73282.1 proton-conducting transporter membrane subunit [Fimbriimonadaceae bacterium]
MSRLPLLFAVPAAGVATFLATSRGQTVEPQGVPLGGLPWVFMVLIAAMGTLVLVYAGGYSAEDPKRFRLFSLLYAFMGAMLGVAQAGLDPINGLFELFVFWELTSLTSFLLIGYKQGDEAARRSARQALLVTALGGLSLLGGLITYQNEGVTDLSLALILLGAFTKSAQVPFHFWLPGAMKAPTPVSAYLHSATMVKAGVFLLVVLQPQFSVHPAWTPTLLVVGGVTLAFGAVALCRKTDLKQLLAYSTVASLGGMVMLLAIPSPLAAEAVGIFLLAHALYKGALFMVAGAVDHACGTRDIHRLGGLGRTMPVLAVASVLAGLSMFGLPGSAGFAAKELGSKALLKSQESLGALATGGLGAWALAGGIFGLLALMLTVRLFAGRAPDPDIHPHPVPLSMSLPPLILGVAGFLMILLASAGPQQWVQEVQASLGHPRELKYGWQAWYGVDAALGVSVVAWALALGLFALWPRWKPDTSRWTTAATDTAHNLGRAVLSVGERVTRVTQSGSLTNYVALTWATVAGVVGVVAWRLFAQPQNPGLNLTITAKSAPEVLVLIVMVVGAGVAAITQRRLFAALSIGALGLGVAVFFLLHGAPDLAMTQIVVDTLTVLLIVLVFFRLPRLVRQTQVWRKSRDVIISLGVGAAMTVFTLAAMGSDRPVDTAQWVAERTYTEAYGRNIVNVILVDFRGIDTMGEIAVLGIAAFGVTALLRLRNRENLPTTEVAE